VNTPDAVNNGSCIRPIRPLFLCIIQCGAMETIDLTIELLHRSIEIRWPRA